VFFSEAGKYIFHRLYEIRRVTHPQMNVDHANTQRYEHAIHDMGEAGNFENNPTLRNDAYEAVSITASW